MDKHDLIDLLGLWLPFHPFGQEDYLAIVVYWLEQLGDPAVPSETACAEALRWALHRGSRSGRVAWQFARDWVGRRGL